jgi:hypothetical protein
MQQRVQRFGLHGQALSDELVGQAGVAQSQSQRVSPWQASRQYFQRIAKVIDILWEIAVGADLAFAGVPGKRTAKVRMVNAYLPRLHAAATIDSSLAGAFVRVMGMVDRPEGLLRPDRALRVLWTHLRGVAPAPATGPVSGGEPRKPVARPQVG